MQSLHSFAFFDAGFLFSQQKVFFWSGKGKIIFSVFFNTSPLLNLIPQFGVQESENGIFLQS